MMQFTFNMLLEKYLNTIPAKERKIYPTQGNHLVRILGSTIP